MTESKYVLPGATPHAPSRISISNSIKSDDEDLDHTHRLRALADAVLVGASTVELDDPQLTVRRVSGTNPLRVVLDPYRRLASNHQIFNDGSAPTLVICHQDALTPAPGKTEILGLPSTDDTISPQHILSALWMRGVQRLFIEGGGVTVSRFLQAGLLDRLHLVVAPLLIGSGRPAIQLPTIDSLQSALQPEVRIEMLGRDTLFDCAFSS